MGVDSTVLLRCPPNLEYPSVGPDILGSHELSSQDMVSQVRILHVPTLGEGKKAVDIQTYVWYLGANSWS
jgi:hypothetical protein